MRCSDDGEKAKNASQILHGFQHQKSTRHCGKITLFGQNVHTDEHGFRSGGLYIYIYTYTHIYIYIYTYIHTFIFFYIHTFIHSCIHAFMHSYIHTFIQSYIHTFMHSYIHTYIRSYMHTFIHSYIHSFKIHTFIHTFIHTYILMTILWENSWNSLVFDRGGCKFGGDIPESIMFHRG